MLFGLEVRVLKCTNSNKPNLIDGLCYANCPDSHVRVPGAPYTCRPEPCPTGYYLTGVNTCFRDAETQIAWYSKDIGTLRTTCPSGYTNVASTCWENCPSDRRDDGTACWKDADIYGKGCCCNNCPPGYTDDGCTCRRDVNMYYKKSQPAICSSDRDEIASLCYPKCRDGYWSSSATTCETNNCPSNFYKTGAATCQKDAHTINNPNIGIGETASLLCPDGTQEASPEGICYPNNPPSDYQRHSISLEQWTEKCPDEWEDTGWYCIRPFKNIKKVDPSCPSGYYDNNNNECIKPCLENYENKNGNCSQICPNETINNTDINCGREKQIRQEGILPYEYKLKKRIKLYY